MSHTNNDQHVIDEDILFNSSFDDVPDTKALQSRILQATLDLPQQTLSDQSAEPKVVVFPKFNKQVVSFALAASVALFAFLAVPGLLNQSPVDVDLANNLTVEEIEYQEAMLLYDEFMFAQL